MANLHGILANFSFLSELMNSSNPFYYGDEMYHAIGYGDCK